MVPHAKDAADAKGEVSVVFRASLLALMRLRYGGV